MHPGGREGQGAGTNVTLTSSGRGGSNEAEMASGGLGVSSLEIWLLMPGAVSPQQGSLTPTC